MRVSRSLHRGRRSIPISALLVLAVLSTSPASPADAQSYAQKTTAAVDYIITHADREDMVRMPMRDGIRLSGTVLFPKDRLRQNLPTVLICAPGRAIGECHTVSITCIARAAAQLR